MKDNVWDTWVIGEESVTFILGNVVKDNWASEKQFGGRMKGFLSDVGRVGFLKMFSWLVEQFMLWGVGWAKPFMKSSLKSQYYNLTK